MRLYPETWPAFACAHHGLLAEAWRSRSREVTLEDAWIVALPVTLEDATSALQAAGLLDSDGLIPVDAWAEWFGPVMERIERLRALNDKRWGPRGDHAGNSDVSPSRAEPSRTEPSRPAPRNNGVNTIDDGESQDPPARGRRRGGLQHIREVLNGEAE